MTATTAETRPRSWREAWDNPSLKLQRILAMVLLLCQGGITVTGSLVRVTGSGLGCNTWPLCHEGSLFPVPGAAPEASAPRV